MRWLERILMIVEETPMTQMSKEEAELMVRAARVAVKAARQRGAEPDPRMLAMSKLRLDTDQKTMAAH